MNCTEGSNAGRPRLQRKHPLRRKDSPRVSGCQSQIERRREEKPSAVRLNIVLGAQEQSGEVEVALQERWTGMFRFQLDKILSKQLERERIILAVPKKERDAAFSSLSDWGVQSVSAGPVEEAVIGGLGGGRLLFVLVTQS